MSVEMERALCGAAGEMFVMFFLLGAAFDLIGSALRKIVRSLKHA